MNKNEVIAEQHRIEAKALAHQAVEDMEAAAEAEAKVVRTASFIALDAYQGGATYRFCVRKIAGLGLLPAVLEAEAAAHTAAAKRVTGVEFGHVRDRNKHGQAARALHEAAQLLRYREEYARHQEEYIATMGCDASDAWLLDTSEEALRADLKAQFRAACIDLAQDGRTRRNMTPEMWVKGARRVVEMARAMR